VIGCCALDGMPTIMPTQTSMNSAGWKIAYRYPLSVKAFSRRPFAQKNGAGWSGEAPAAEV
jgi:hypothetical protein